MNADEIELKGLGLTAALRRLSEHLGRHGIENAEAEARMLLLGASGRARSDLILNPQQRLTESAVATLSDWTSRRLAGEPATRILGERAFWTLDLQVTRDVLDPRPDSETIVSAALEFLGERRDEPLRVLDLGTGSGALLLAILSECPRATGIGVDLSDKACAIAGANAERNSLADRVRIVQGRWTDGLAGQFDLVVSNPPYIETAVIPDLSVEVREHDPMLALDGGEDGLSAYRDIVSALPAVMRPEAGAVLELGIGQGPAVSRLAERAGLKVVGCRRDLGGVERALILGRVRSRAV